MKRTSEDNRKITKVYSREILDSRGCPTIEVEVHTRGCSGRASVPSGVSTGVHEALELRDHDETRYNGKGVQTAVKNVREVIAPKIIGKDVTQQRILDNLMIELDATENKSRLGANAILGVSLATAKAASNALGVPLYKYLGGEEARLLPVPMMNVINGGLHAGNKLSVQEFMILPTGAKTFSEALRMGAEVYHALKKLLREKYGSLSTNVGDEGGFAPPIKETGEALNILVKAIERAGYSPGKDFYLGLDAAAERFYNPKKEEYVLDNRAYTTDALLNYYKNLVEEYPLASIEDPLHEEDFQGYASITRELGNTVQIVGDDLFVTNMERLKKGIKEGAANAILLKVNQIGSLTEALDAAYLAKKSGYSVIVSHRSGETGDTYIADIAVALNAGQIKAGAPARGERIVKYNRLLNIESQLASRATYAGASILRA